MSVPKHLLEEFWTEFQKLKEENLKKEYFFHLISEIFKQKESLPQKYSVSNLKILFSFIEET